MALSPRQGPSRHDRPPPKRRSQLPYLFGALLAIAAFGFIFNAFGVATSNKSKSTAPGTVVQQNIPERSAPFTEETEPRQSQNQAWYQNQPAPPKLVTAPSPPLRLLLPEEPATQPQARPRAYEEELPNTLYQPEATPVVEQAALSKASPQAPPTSPNQLPNWRKFAVDFKSVGPGTGLPMIAIVIDDAGVDRKRSARAAALPGPLTISYLTYAAGLPEQTRLAREAGHELMVHVAMEPMNSTVDPGPRVLRTKFDAEELLLRLRWGLSQFTGYVGINNHMGSRFTSDEAGMRTILAELKARGLLFLDSRTSQTTVGGKIAREIGLPYAERNVFLDHEPNIEVVRKQLALVEREGRRRGYVTAIGHPRDATLDALEAWLPTLADKGFQLAPISAIVARRAGIGVGAANR